MQTNGELIGAMFPQYAARIRVLIDAQHADDAELWLNKPARGIRRTLSDAFTWSNTDEGYAFWAALVRSKESR